MAKGLNINQIILVLTWSNELLRISGTIDRKRISHIVDEVMNSMDARHNLEEAKSVRIRDFIEEILIDNYKV